MTPALQAVQQAKIDYRLHEYHLAASSDSYSLEAAEALGVEPGRVFKTLIAALNGTKDELAVAIVPASGKLDLKGLARAAQAKNAQMADPKVAERATGYVLGGISPLGQKKRLLTILDESALGCETIFVSAGKRGLQIELKPADLIQLCDATVAPIAR